MDVPRPVGPDCRACGAALGPGADWCWRCLAPLLVRVPDAQVLPSPHRRIRRSWLALLALALVGPAAALAGAWVRTVGPAGAPLGLLVLGSAVVVVALVPRLARVGRHPGVLLLPRPGRLVRIDGPLAERPPARRPQS